MNIISSPIDSLPAEMTLKIFYYLTPKDLAICGKVCGAWRDIVTDRTLALAPCLEKDYKHFISSELKFKQTIDNFNKKPKLEGCQYILECYFNEDPAIQIIYRVRQGNTTLDAPEIVETALYTNDLIRDTDTAPGTVRTLVPRRGLVNKSGLTMSYTSNLPSTNSSIEDIVWDIMHNMSRPRSPSTIDYIFACGPLMVGSSVIAIVAAAALRYYLT
jgi:hypothetical protein